MLLKIGSKGNDVITLQKFLKLTSDGDFGPGTDKAVKDWQTKNGLTPDGIVGDSTWNKMFNTEISSSNLKLDKIKGVIPDSVISQIPVTAAKFNITNNLRLAHFLSQCATESGNFKITTENLNYSAKGLGDTFKKYFPTVELANAYAKKPEKIANRVYGNRMGNGDEASGDGYKFRGRGFIQLTGKSNYQKFTGFIGEDCTNSPDLVATKYPLASAAFFFNANGLWAICDKGSTSDTVLSVTKRVNGGTNGLSERQHYFDQFWSLLK